MNTKQKKHTQTPKQEPEQKPTPTQKQKPEQKPKHTTYIITKALTEPTDKPKLVDSRWVLI